MQWLTLPDHIITDVRRRGVVAFVVTLPLTLTMWFGTYLLSLVWSSGSLAGVWLLMLIATGVIGGLLSGHWSGPLSVTAGFSLGLFIFFLFVPPADSSDDDLLTDPSLFLHILAGIVVWLFLTALFLPGVAIACHKSNQHRLRALASCADGAVQTAAGVETTQP